MTASENNICKNKQAEYVMARAAAGAASGAVPAAGIPSN